MYEDKIQHVCYIIAEIATLKIYSLIDNRVALFFLSFLPFSQLRSI